MTKIEAAIEKADLAFWGSIAESYPEATSRDLDFGMVLKLGCAQKQAVQMWLDDNVPLLGP